MPNSRTMLPIAPLVARPVPPLPEPITDWRPMPIWAEKFLAIMRISANSRQAVLAAGIAFAHASLMRRTLPRFDEAWTDAIYEARDILLQEAWHRALSGKSDKVLLALLRIYFPESFQHARPTNAEGQFVTNTQNTITINYAAERERLRALVLGPGGAERLLTGPTLPALYPESVDVLEDQDVF